MHRLCLIQLFNHHISHLNISLRFHLKVSDIIYIFTTHDKITIASQSLSNSSDELNEQ